MRKYPCLGVLSAFVASAALAHHSPSAYDMTGNQVTVEGTLTKVDWANPHIYLTLETEGANGQRVLQQVEAVSISLAQATGLTRDVLTLGSTVAVQAFPNRRGSGQTVLGTEITTSDGNVYPLRGGRSSRPPAATVPATGLAGNWAPKPSGAPLMNVVHGWPLSDKGRAVAADVMSGRRQLTVGCTAIPLPMVAMLAMLRTIDVRDDRVVITHDSDGIEVTRTVHLVAQHPANVEPSPFGHSIGRWEGDTLVIDTVAFTPHDIGIGFGIPSGAGKHLIERLTLAADRLQLRYELTVEDPEYLSSPATYTAMWDHRPDLAPGTPCDPENSERFRDE